MTTVEKKGYQLPDDIKDGLSCLNYFGKLLYCLGPRGRLQSYFRYGHVEAICDYEKANLLACIKIKTKHTGKQEALTQAKQRSKDLREAEIWGSSVPPLPVWEINTSPPSNWTSYEKIRTQEEEDEILREFFSKASSSAPQQNTSHDHDK
eukprot:TRINITY_DN8046_c0_g1_i3.p1 TRINITY_DN8046_c0_g1~~TRINITY_DN8046_c0_g1_i3.p1  ORF type:complete len:150 (+),score=24.59 TRINITY_DN8046_c0_g1_i3:52-501(+)